MRSLQQLAVERMGRIIRITETIMQQIAGENPYQPEYQFEAVAYEWEEQNGLPDGITAFDLIANFRRFREDGATWVLL